MKIRQEIDDRQKQRYREDRCNAPHAKIAPKSPSPAVGVIANRCDSPRRIKIHSKIAENRRHRHDRLGERNEAEPFWAKHSHKIWQHQKRKQRDADLHQREGAEVFEEQFSFRHKR